MPDDLTVAETPWFRVSACRDCDVPGYLILSAREHTLAEMPAPALASLGPLMSAVELAAREATRAECVYLLRFAESGGGLHFHVFPRTAALALQWRTETGHPAGSLIGEDIFSWARRTHLLIHGATLSAATLEVARTIRERLAAALTRDGG